MSNELLELQAEEREALQSIYERDSNFKEINSTTFQYKFGADDDIKSFLVEFHWGEAYPAEAPVINMETFYNRNLISTVKAKIRSTISKEAEQWLGCGMTYTLIEHLKDNIETLTTEQISIGPKFNFADLDANAIKITGKDTEFKKKDLKKDNLTKSQKRRQWERTDCKGDRPRGWDWVDLIKHLSQTGVKNDGSSPSTTLKSCTSALCI